MTVSLQTSENEFSLKARKMVSLKSPVVRTERVGGGGNSRVFKVQCADGKWYCVKFYFSSPDDQRDRLGTEYGSLKFIDEQGIGAVPQPVFVDRAELMGVYEWINGRKITADTVTVNDIDFAVNFLAQLEKLSHHPDARQFNTASAGCFCVKDIIDHIETKLQKFQSCPTDTEEFRRLKVYLDQDFAPLLNEILSWVRTSLGDISFDEGIGANLRTLSPSDFGFHNALRKDNGEITFLDFEYFGWDDSAKMIVDFTFHPAMELSFGLKQSFYQKMLLVFKQDTSLKSRIACYYPLLGLLWCLIFLNEFIKNDLKRRQFAMVGVKDTATIQQRQLKKAQDLLSQVRSSYKKFPYEY